MKFSLILCTLGQTELIKKNLDSIVKQTYKNLELIVVDQNKDDVLKDILKDYEDKIFIKHIKSEKGLSKSRNVGISIAEGDIIAFPDDDCEYDYNTLEKVSDFFNKNKDYDFMSIKMTNNYLGGRKIQEGIKSQELNKRNCIKLVASISLFCKKNVIDTIGGFDENLGLGTKTEFKGSEDYDYPLRALKQGFRGYFNNSIEVFHPWDDNEIELSKKIQDRGFYGGAAEMYVLKKHNFNIFYRLCRIIRRVLIIIFYMLKRDNYKVKHSVFILKGMLKYIL